MAITGTVNWKGIPHLFVPAKPSPTPAMQQLHVGVNPIAHLAGESCEDFLSEIIMDFDVCVEL